MSLKDCITAAVRQGHITLEEGQSLAKRYDNIAKQVLSTGEAKAQFVAEIEIEAAERKRRAFLMEGVRSKLLAEIKGYRNLKGEEDIAEAFLMMHENFGRMGSYIADAESARTVIQRQAHAQLGDLLREFRKGAITGDLRRSRPQIHARLQNVVRELFGESTGDAPAAMMAKSWEKVSEDLRIRFNEAGGAIGKLEKWGLPQGHDQQALLDYGKGKWVDRLMQDGVLDRDKTVHPLTKRRMTDEELRESLNVIWDRITTDGWIDREASGVPTGKGALWSQHADHRFLHFKSADAWMDYAKAFGNPDPYGAMMGHVNKMARDIAHMEKFGPNPTVIRNYIKQHLQSEAAKVKSTEVVLGEQIEQLRDLSGKLTRPNPEREKITAEIADVLKELDAERRSKWGKRHGRYMREERDPLSTAKVAEVELRMDSLYQKMTTLTDKLKGAPATIRDAEIAHAIDLLTEEMRDPIQFANTKNPQSHLTQTLYKADARWELMRGSMSPVNASFANVMASTRNFISAASLGSAWASSLADPMFGQDMRLRMGMGLAKANLGRVLTVALKEMVTMGKREDAVQAGLGLDSAIDVMHRTAKENSSMDARAWTGYLADRTLTYGMLSPWTQAGKHLAGLDLMAWFADNTKNDWAHLPDGLRKGLVSHGFDAASWDLIRNVPLYEPKRGVFYLRAPDIEGAAGRDLSERFAAMILRETRYAVPEATVASRAVGGATRPGTMHGEVWRSMMQFKGFGIAVVMLHANRMARELMAGDRSAASMAGAMLITGAFLGAVSMTLKDIKDGRDPRKWLDEKTYLDPMFWGAAALQSGGLGIYGDFLFSNTGRTGSGLGKTMVGPVVDRIDNVLGVTLGNVGQSIRGEKTNRGRETVKLIRQNTPVIGNNIFVGLAYQRVLMDQLQRLADPEAHADFRRQIQHRRKDFKQDFWWEPGSSSPRRGPDLTRPLATR